MARIEFLDALRQGLEEQNQTKQALQGLALQLALSGRMEGRPFPIPMDARAPMGQFTQGLINAGLVESPAALGGGSGDQFGLANLSQTIEGLHQKYGDKFDFGFTRKMAGGTLTIKSHREKPVTPKTISPTTAASFLKSPSLSEMSRKRVGGIGNIGFGPGSYLEFTPEELALRQHVINLMNQQILGASGVADPTTPESPEADPFMLQLQQQGYEVEPIE